MSLSEASSSGRTRLPLLPGPESAGKFLLPLHFWSAFVGLSQALLEVSRCFFQSSGPKKGFLFATRGLAGHWAAGTVAALRGSRPRSRAEPQGVPSARDVVGLVSGDVGFCL